MFVRIKVGVVAFLIFFTVNFKPYFDEFAFVINLPYQFRKSNLLCYIPHYY